MSAEHCRVKDGHPTPGKSTVLFLSNFHLFVNYFGGLECVGHSFAYVANFVILRDVWIRTQSAVVTSRLAANLASVATHLPQLIHPYPLT